MLTHIKRSEGAHKIENSLDVLHASPEPVFADICMAYIRTVHTDRLRRVQSDEKH